LSSTAAADFKRLSAMRCSSGDEDLMLRVPGVRLVRTKVLLARLID
jgi:hypothetical protein